MSGSISGSESNVYHYAGMSGESISILTAWTGGGISFGPVFDLLAPDGSVLLHGQTLVLGLRLTNAGVYQIVSRDGDAFDQGTYELSLISHPGPNQTENQETNQIVAGQTVSGSTGWADLDAYTYTSGGGEAISILTTWTGGGISFGPAFDLLGPDGSVLLQGQRFVLSFRLTNAGVYQIVSRDGDAFDQGTYGLSVIRHPGPNQADDAETNAIVAGQTVSGSTGWADLDAYTYTSGGGEAISLLTTWTGGGISFGPVFDLLAPDGSVLLHGQTLVLGLRLTNAGVYQIVSRDGDAFDQGTYGLSVIRHPGPNQADENETDRIGPGQTVSGSTGWADMDVYDFQAIAGDSVAVWVNVTSGGASFNPIIDIISTEGFLIASGTRIRTGCLEQGGSFQIVVRDADAFDAGRYVLQLTQTPGPPPDEATPEYLQILNCSGQVSVRWRTNAIGFRLQATEQLTSPTSAANWLDIPPPYSAIDGFYFATNTLPASTRFFRLIDP